MNNTPIHLIRGTEANILNRPFNDGSIYVAIDTKRIYVDSYMDGAPQNKLSVGGGGSSGIFYAKKTFIESSDLTFALSDLEGADDLPSVGDLIINYKSKNETRDGFYKVIAVNMTTNTVDVEYLPVGGGGSSSGSAGGGEIKIIPITEASGITTSEKGYSIKYSIEAYNNAGVAVITPGKAVFTINGIQVDGGEVVHGKTYDFDITPYLNSAKETNTIRLKVSLNTGGIVDDSQTYDWTVKCIDLKLDWDWIYGYKNYIKENTFTLSWTVSGGVNCQTHISIDDGAEPDKNYFVVNLLSSEFEGSKTLNSLPYGDHKITMWATTKIGEETISTDKIENVLTFVRGDETRPILTVPYFVETARQYDTIRIPFLVYQPDAEKVKVTFYVDNIPILTDEYAVVTDTLHYLPYTLGRAGEVKLKLAVTASPNIFYETQLKVAPLDLGIVEPTEGKGLFLKASDLSGNVQLRELETKEHLLTFSENFDWVNGGLKTEVDEDGNINNYICVRQGTTMTINYKLFENTQVGTQGKVFKFCFKATNCYDYHAPVLECYEESTKLGLKFNAQQALFSSSTNTNFATQYCEGSYIELETEIWPDQADNGSRPGDRFLMFWVDGVPAAVQPFASGASFRQNVPKNIVIGSSQCDVYVYLVKIYERKLSSIEHLNNFILDAPNVNEKLKRFERNNILGKNGEISYELLVEKNPGCHAYLYKLTEQGMTVGTDDEKGDQRPCDYMEYYLTSSTPHIVANDATMIAQGTSSAAYGIAAFNVRTDFGDTTMYDGNGNVLPGKKVSETSIPIDYTCTKVNVASCEGVNNALNQEWYNKYQPYHDAHRRKSTPEKQYRDCMEFDFGVMFVEDHNPNTSFIVDNKPNETEYIKTNVFAYNTEGRYDSAYMQNPYYKLYAVANMGNDKKNRDIFHDRNNEKACCVEIADNNNAEHWFVKTIDYNNLDYSEWDKVFKTDINPEGFYEFRFSIEKTKVKNPTITLDDQKKAFLDFVNWMASCDPNPKSDSHPNGYTGLPLEGGSKTYGAKTFQGFDPPGYENQKNPTGVSLKGFVTDKYAGTYTHDTLEYRIAKMLDECEDHFVMDSVVYHYLFIERHTMVDNLAKNTFWSTEDLIHWDLTKNYDNDTADGNDNSGYLVYGYGHEIKDKKADGGYMFNGSESVWVNFIYHIKDVQDHLYAQLQNKGAWDATEYLKLFKSKQDLIPERCRIEDYFRKYIRPRRLGLDGSNKYIQRLEGGVKTHQRKQYERYQGYYIDSKHCAGSSFKDTGSLDMRLNKGPTNYQLTTDTAIIENKQYFSYETVTDFTGASWQDYVLVKIEDASINPSAEGYYEIVSGGWTTKEEFPISYYIDLYPSAKIGGQIWRSPTRLPRGQQVKIPVGTIIDAPTDATCYIYAADMIQTISGIAETYPNYIGISAASKLREFEAGSTITGYFNNKLNNAVLDQNTQLEKAQLQQVGSNQLSGLDLSRLAMLKELKINMNSTFPSLKLAKGGIIDTLYINPLMSLNLKDLKELNDFQYDPGVFDSLTSVCIQDCPTLNEFGYSLVKHNRITNYCFNNVNWTVPTSDINIGNPTTIQILENLLTTDDEGNKLKQPFEVSSQALALTGVLKINLDSDLSNGAVNEYAVYAEYKREFPGLEIEYTGNLNALAPAKTITFYNDYNADEEKYGDIIYQVKTDGSKRLDWLMSSAGPTGVAIATPSKDSDKYYDYEWDGTWKDETGEIYDAQKLAVVIPNTNKIFVAQYNSTLHQYSVTLRDSDGSDIAHSFGTQSYGSNITENMPYYLYKPHTTDGMRYEFQGWISSKDYLGGTSNPEVIQDFIVTTDVTYYAYYKEQACVSVASRLDYFEFTDGGYTINLQEKYRDLIKEPITLPLKNGTKLITTIGNFGAYDFTTRNGKNIVVSIPKVYFLNNGVGGEYQSISNYAFWSSKQSSNENRMELEAIYLPSTIKSIGEAAFQGCKKLKTVNLPNGLDDNCGVTSIATYAFDSTGMVEIEERNDYSPLAKLISLGLAFYMAGPGVKLFTIPEGLKSIAAYCFFECENVAFEDFSTLQSLGLNSLANCGKNKTINIVLPSSLSGYANNCFSDYAKGNINTVTHVGGESVDNEELNRLGLSYSNPITIESVID